MRFVSYDVEPVKEFGSRANICEPEEADFWSIYGRLESGEVICIGDFSTRDAAEQIKDAIQAS